MDTTVQTLPPRDDFFRKKYTSTVSFAVGILLFLLPFAEFKCASVTLAENTGIGIAIGKRWNIVDMGQGKNWMDKKDGDRKLKNDLLEGKLNIFLILALVTALLGLGISFSDSKIRAVTCMCAGILAAVMLIAVMIQYKFLLRSAFKDLQTEYDMSTVVRIQFTFWYFLSLAAFAAAAFFSYKHHQIEFKDALANHVDFDFQRNEVQQLTGNS